jgi:Methyltransferase domain
MLNWAARYYPIVRVLKAHGLFHDASLLEIGSGSVGIGRFRKVPFVGCDLNFSTEPAWPMTPITASAAQLPMKDKEFDVVVASDVLEHIPPNLRQTVIGETLRVARKLVIFGFPCGQHAWESDKALFKVYLDAQKTPPQWLAEHMDAPFPGIELFQEMDGWDIQRMGNENIRFHFWLMEREMSYRFIRASVAVMRAVPFLLELLLRQADRSPFYRQIFVLSRRS